MNDYISREAVFQKFLERGSGYINELTMRDMINEIPAADVQPVKHGKWKTPVSVENDIKFCSICRNEAYWNTDYGQQLFDYCPYCGAKMMKDGKQND
jgi:hypothetical protein